MITWLPIVLGIVAAASIYLILSFDRMRMAAGIFLLSSMINIYLFTIGRLTKNEAPIIADNADHIAHAFANPLPQALILTAIVISFGLSVFLLALLLRIRGSAQSQGKNSS